MLRGARALLAAAAVLGALLVAPTAAPTAAPGAEPGAVAGGIGAAPVLEPVASSPLDGPPTGAALDRSAVTRTLRPRLSGGALGQGRTPARVVDVATGEVLYSASDVPTVPASTLKLVTAVSVLGALGPDSVLATRTVLQDAEATTPVVVVVGAGDPSLRSTSATVGGAGTRLHTATMRDLARRTARALEGRGIDRVRLAYDDDLFTGAALHPSWSRAFPGAGVVAPVSALQVDGSRRTPRSVDRVADPAAAAARVLARQLRSAGIAVRGTPRRAGAADSAQAMAQVSSPTVGDLVERMLATSDNDYAEALARLGAIASGHPGSFAGVAARAGEVLAGLDLDSDGVRVVDGSGLSRRDRLSPSTLSGLLTVVAAGGYGAISSGLPVARATGSLRGRFDVPAQAPARGLVRAKTGTLSGVAGLAGYASRPDGRLLAFAFLDGSAPGGTHAARDALDRAIAALVSCDCAAG